jgi:hypothetical protein
LGNSRPRKTSAWLFGDYTYEIVRFPSSSEEGIVLRYQPDRAMALRTFQLKTPLRLHEKVAEERWSDR